MTECTQSHFEFQAHYSREVVARFDGGTMSSDGGALLLRQTDRRLHLLSRVAECFEDHRSPWLTTHSVGELGFNHRFIQPETFSLRSTLWKPAKIA